MDTKKLKNIIKEYVNSNKKFGDGNKRTIKSIAYAHGFNNTEIHANGGVEIHKHPSGEYIYHAKHMGDNWIHGIDHGDDKPVTLLGDGDSVDDLYHHLKG